MNLFFNKAYFMLAVLLTVSSPAMMNGDGEVASLTPSLRGGSGNGVVEGKGGGAIRELFKIPNPFSNCPDGNVNDSCSPWCPCSGSNTCEVGPNVCRAPPGEENDPCSLTRPCGDGLICAQGTQEQYRQVCLSTGEENDPCSRAQPCGDDLTCEAGFCKGG